MGPRGSQEVLRIPRILRVALIAVVGLAAAPAVFAAPPVDFSDELVLGGLDQPVALGFIPGDGRMLIVQRSGTILIADLNANPVVASPYLTVPDVEATGERGLFSIAFDPNFAVNDYFYVYYTNATQARHRIARFTHSGNSASPASETVIWEDAQTWSGIGHIGGGLDFGPDGMLYLATGDENNGMQAQDLTQSGGKIIRVAPDGSIPPDNPFVGGAAMGQDESIWARGLRNPLRLKWDLVSQKLFVGDVGQDTLEEIHQGFSGANFGWPICDGPCSSAQFDDPLFHYLHDVQGGAVIGGFVYGGSAFPAQYAGTYFYADFVQGWIHYLDFDASGNLTGDFVFDPNAGPLVFLDEGPDGSIYYIEFSLASGLSEIRRIRYAPDSPVIQSATADVTQGPGPSLSVTFSGVATDPQMDPLSYRWIFGDGAEAFTAVASHTYLAKGRYTAQLEVSDGVNLRLSDPIEITVGAPPVLAILSPIDQSLFRGGETILLNASFSDPDGVLTAADLDWDVSLFHNGHNHPEAQLSGVASGQFLVPVDDHDFHDDTGFDITLSATDSDGLTTTVSHRIQPDKIELVFDTAPAGLMILRDSIPRTAPHPYETLIDFQHGLDAPSPQCLGGTEYVFDAWSDGGAQSHVIVVPDAPQTITASFLDVGPCVRVATNQVALYEFADSAGATVADSSGVAPALDLTIANPSNATWLAGGGLSVDAETQIDSPGVASKIIDAVKLSGEVTVEAWIEPDDPLLFGPRRIIALSEGANVGANLVLGQGLGPTEPDRYSARFRTDTTSAFGTPSIDSPLQSLNLDLTHVVFTRDSAGDTTLYLNGAPVTTSTATGSLSVWADTPLTLANEPTGDRAWTGDLHLVAFYDRALAPAEIAQNLRALTPENMPPVAAADSYTVDQGQTLAVSAFAGVLSNDVDPDGNTIIAELESGVAYGTLLFQPDGSFTYTHDGSPNLFDSFDYAVDDGLTTSSATVSLTILTGPAAEITAEPLDRKVGVGESAVFHCGTTNGIPVSLEWQRDGVPHRRRRRPDVRDARHRPFGFRLDLSLHCDQRRGRGTESRRPSRSRRERPRAFRTHRGIRFPGRDGRCRARRLGPGPSARPHGRRSGSRQLDPGRWPIDRRADGHSLRRTGLQGAGCRLRFRGDLHRSVDPDGGPLSIRARTHRRLLAGFEFGRRKLRRRSGLESDERRVHRSPTSKQRHESVRRAVPAKRPGHARRRPDTRRVHAGCVGVHAAVHRWRVAGDRHHARRLRKLGSQRSYPRQRGHRRSWLARHASGRGDLRPRTRSFRSEPESCRRPGIPGRAAACRPGSRSMGHRGTDRCVDGHGGLFEENSALGFRLISGFLRVSCVRNPMRPEGGREIPLDRKKGVTFRPECFTLA